MTAFPYLVPTMPEIPGEMTVSDVELRRLTLIARSAGASLEQPHGSARVVTVDALAMLLRASIDGVIPIDIERVILDRSTSVAEFLDFLVALPQEFIGDVLLISEDRGAYLSSAGRGAGRILYSLTASDVDFYVLTHDLAAESELIGRSATE